MKWRKKNNWKLVFDIKSSNLDKAQTSEDQENCDQCGKLFSRSRDLVAHVKFKHLGEKDRCNHCNRTFSRKRDFLAHITFKHQGNNDKWNECNKVFADKTSLKEHIRQIHEGLVYLCPQCNWSTKQKHYLKDHLRYKHRGLLYKCDVGCDFSKGMESFYSNHSCNKEDNVLYRCYKSKCEFSAAQKLVLKKHIQKDHVSGTYKCQFGCDFITDTKPNYQKHIFSIHDL